MVEWEGYVGRPRLAMTESHDSRRRTIRCPRLRQESVYVRACTGVPEWIPLRDGSAWRGTGSWTEMGHEYTSTGHVRTRRSLSVLQNLSSPSRRMILDAISYACPRRQRPVLAHAMRPQ